ncbi:hypothetical protein J437_LFUL005493 [Ladona fulva]|uniref:Uncharacterized protein n=1 Tax=Ladona fulva TaxID=123851 RepID=A0A8K0K321_LADFU|nr:hypothetical protein J437_LFUL005493 [Ladona fulva]
MMRKPDALRELKNELNEYRFKVEALQEIRWTVNGIIKSGDHIVFYSGGNNGRNGTGFMMEKGIKPAILKFNPVNDQICSLRVKASFFNGTIISVYAPKDDAEEEDEDEFYSKLEEGYENIPTSS